VSLFQASLPAHLSKKVSVTRERYEKKSHCSFPVSLGGWCAGDGGDQEVAQKAVRPRVALRAFDDHQPIGNRKCGSPISELASGHEYENVTVWLRFGHDDLQRVGLDSTKTRILMQSDRELHRIPCVLGECREVWGNRHREKRGDDLRVGCAATSPDTSCVAQLCWYCATICLAQFPPIGCWHIPVLTQRLSNQTVCLFAVDWYRTKITCEGKSQQVQKSQSMCISELREANRHIRMTSLGLILIGAKEAVPQRETEPVVAVRFADDDRVMHPVHVGCHQ
jgi:hypothetical protein